MSFHGSLSRGTMRSVLQSAVFPKNDDSFIIAARISIHRCSRYLAEYLRRAIGRTEKEYIWITRPSASRIFVKLSCMNTISRRADSSRPCDYIVAWDEILSFGDVCVCVVKNTFQAFPYAFFVQERSAFYGCLVFIARHTSLSQ